MFSGWFSSSPKESVPTAAEEKARLKELMAQDEDFDEGSKDLTWVATRAKLSLSKVSAVLVESASDGKQTDVMRLELDQLGVEYEARPAASADKSHILHCIREDSSEAHDVDTKTCGSSGNDREYRHRHWPDSFA